MLTSSILSLAAQACLGDWAYLPADLEREVGFQLSVAPSNAFRLVLTDFGRAAGIGQPQSDGSVTLKDGDETFTLRDCEADSAQFEFPDGRVFTLVRPDRDFWELARQRGWEAENDVVERPSWTARRFARWTVSVEESDSARRCEMVLRGNQYVKVMYIQHAQGRGRISMHADIAEPMSNLRAQTFEPNLGGMFLFDGDVGLAATGQRVGRTGILSPSNEVRFLEYLAAANGVTLRFEYGRIAQVNLSGSAAAVDALRDCIAAL